MGFWLWRQYKKEYKHIKKSHISNMGELYGVYAKHLGENWPYCKDHMALS